MFDLTAQFDLTLEATTPVQIDDLIERHKAMVFRTAWRILGEKSDAEDITQEVFLRLYKTKEEPSAPWIYRITVNLCLDQIRKRKPQATESTLETLQSSQPNPEQQLELEQKQQRLARLIAKLPERERACLVLRDLEGLNSREVASILDCTEETVRTSIHRAKEKLKQWMI
jgi:RNA polymerase sigma-70 factor (ECF subfamily)